MASSPLIPTSASSSSSSSSSSSNPNTVHQPSLFTFPSRKSSRSNTSDSGKPGSPTTTSTSIYTKEPSSPVLSASQRHDSVSTAGHSRRRTSILSFLSSSSRKTSMSDESDDLDYSHDDSKPGSFHFVGRNSRWSRRKSRSQVSHASIETIDHACCDDPRKASDMSQLSPSHEISFLDSVIPEEGLSEEYEPCHNYQTRSNNKGPNSYDIEWFTCEEDAQKRTQEIMRGRERGSAHWLHSAGTTSASAGSNVSHSDAESASDASDEEDKTKSSNTGGRILGKLSSMAGLNGNANSGRNKRDRASSVPIQRKSSEKPATAGGRKKSRPKSLTAAELKAGLAKGEGEKELDGSQNGEQMNAMSSGPLQKALTPAAPSTTEGSSMWNTLNKKGMKALSMFSPNPRGDYAAISAT